MTDERFSFPEGESTIKIRENISAVCKEINAKVLKEVSSGKVAKNELDRIIDGFLISNRGAKDELIVTYDEMMKDYISTRINSKTTVSQTSLSYFVRRLENRAQNYDYVCGLLFSDAKKDVENLSFSDVQYFLYRLDIPLIEKSWNTEKSRRCHALRRMIEYNYEMKKNHGMENVMEIHIVNCILKELKMKEITLPGNRERRMISDNFTSILSKYREFVETLKQETEEIHGIDVSIYRCELRSKRKLTMSDIISRAESWGEGAWEEIYLNRFFANITDPRNMLGRESVLMMCRLMRLTADETNNVLMDAGMHMLYPRLDLNFKIIIHQEYRRIYG